MVMDDEVLVTVPTPVDLTGVRDEGVQALITLAVSLGWNVMQKRGNPAVITSRGGYQKRLPTNSSVRISVFQTALSAIMLHTEPNVVPTLELIDAIITSTKPSADHRRRLLLAVGETPKQHRERIAAAEAEAKGPREPVPLTTRIEFEMPEPEEPEEELDELAMHTVAPAADGAEHGGILTIAPFKARKATDISGSASFYESDISYQRNWEDGYVDYTCMVCGRAFGRPKGVGAHSQIHTDLDRSDPAWKRRPVVERVRLEPTIEWGDPPPLGTEPIEEEVAAPAAAEGAFPAEIAVPRVEEPEYPDLSDDFPVALDALSTITEQAADKIMQILGILIPGVIEEVRSLTEERDVLRQKCEILTARLTEVEGEFDAFIEMASARRKRAEGD